VLQASFGEDIEGVTHCTAEHLNFCMDIVAPTKTVRCFPNNKPWITLNVKHLLNMKKRAFKEGDQAERKLKTMLGEAKDSYRGKVEQKLQENSMREVWEAMNTITGCKKSGGPAEGDVVRANQFNHFDNRFDNTAPGVNDCLTPVPAPPPISPISG